MKKLSENIRPKSIHHEQKKLLEKEILDFFIDTQTNTLKNSIAVNLSCCPACFSKRQKFYLIKLNFKLEECLDCGLIFTNPRPLESSIVDFFSKSKSMDLYSKMINESSTIRTELIFEPITSYILNNIGSRGRLLEVGCGNGLLLDCLKTSPNSSWDLSGIEINEASFNICKNKGLNVFHGALEHFETNSKFDLIIFWAVFDHFFDPLSIARKSFDLLNPGGKIFIGNMNIEGFDSLILGADNFAFTPPERQNFFGSTSMSLMLKNAGFEDINFFTNGSLDTDIVKNYWENGNSHGRNPFFDKIFNSPDPKILENFQKFLQVNKLSGHMTMIGNKPLLTCPS
jgi:2-polyprenyl-3-methyl-5-hydroxy-6-metoxy-1,4-benzoquinol methylase